MAENESTGEKMGKIISSVMGGTLLGMITGVFIIVIGTTIFSGSNVFEWNLGGPIGGLVCLVFIGMVIGCGVIGAVSGVYFLAILISFSKKNNLS